MGHLPDTHPFKGTILDTPEAKEISDWWKAEYRRRCEAKGVNYLPLSETWDMSAEYRERWARVTGNQADDGRPVIKHDKTKRMTEFVKANVGKSVSMDELAKACDATASTAYTFLRNNPGRFVQWGVGRYVIVDPAVVREREAAGLPPLEAMERPRVAVAPSGTAAAVENVERLLGAATGHPIRTVLPRD